jgi:hypothetical protein
LSSEDSFAKTRRLLQDFETTDREKLRQNYEMQLRASKGDIYTISSNKSIDKLSDPGAEEPRQMVLGKREAARISEIADEPLIEELPSKRMRK